MNSVIIVVLKTNSWQSHPSVSYNTLMWGNEKSQTFLKEISEHTHSSCEICNELPASKEQTKNSIEYR